MRACAYSIMLFLSLHVHFCLQNKLYFLTGVGWDGWLGERESELVNE